MFVCLYNSCFLSCVEGMLQGDSTVRDVYLPTAQHDGFSQDLCSVPFVEQHNARGQLSSYSDTHRHTLSVA